MDSLHPYTHTRTLSLTLIILTGFPSSKNQHKKIEFKTGNSIPCHCLFNALLNSAFKRVILENQLCLHKGLLGAKDTLEYKTLHTLQNENSNVEKNADRKISKNSRNRTSKQTNKQSFLKSLHHPSATSTTACYQEHDHWVPNPVSSLRN